MENFGFDKVFCVQQEMVKQESLWLSLEDTGMCFVPRVSVPHAEREPQIQGLSVLSLDTTHWFHLAGGLYHNKQNKTFFEKHQKKLGASFPLKSLEKVSKYHWKKVIIKWLRIFL